MGIKLGDNVTFLYRGVSGKGTVFGFDEGQVYIELSRTSDGKGAYLPDNLVWIPQACVRVTGLSEYDDAMKEDFIIRMGLSEREIAGRTGEEIAYARKWIDELSDKENFAGLYLKGFHSYSGDAVYPQDFYVARTCLEKCVKMRCATDAANALGYIYFYGRCNNGLPEYEKAFRYFSIAAMDENPESIYKIGDMFLNGLGVPKNENLAETLYKKVYDNSKTAFCNDPDGFNKFADAALRLARIAAGKNYFTDSVVYSYFLEARYAISKRMRLGSFIGDEEVSRSIEDGIGKYGPENTSTVYVCDDAFALMPFEECEDIIKVTVKKQGRSGSNPDATVAKFTLEIVDRNTLKKSRYTTPLLMTIPKLSSCNLVKSYSFRTSVESDFEEETFFATRIEPEYYGIGFTLLNMENRYYDCSDFKFRKPVKSDLFETSEGAYI